jgi:chromosome segregation ATPase
MDWMDSGIGGALGAAVASASTWLATRRQADLEEKRGPVDDYAKLTQTQRMTYDELLDALRVEVGELREELAATREDLKRARGELSQARAEIGRMNLLLIEHDIAATSHEPSTVTTTVTATHTIEGA